MLKRFMLCSLLVLAACVDKEVANTVNNDLAAAEVSLTGVERLAKIYTDLPRCGSVKVTTAICSDPVLVSKIASLDSTAYNAVRAAKTNSAMLSVAITAIQDLRSAIPITAAPAK